MKDSGQVPVVPRFSSFCATVLLLLGSILPCSSTSRAESLGATYAEGRLSLDIPYHAARAGSGELVVELLDPEDKVLGRAARKFDLRQGDGSLQQYLTPDAKLPLEELVWERVRYRFVYSGERNAAFEGIKSVSLILRRPVVHILGQRSYLTGGKAAIRVIVTDSNDKAILGHGTVRVELLRGDRASALLFTGELNRRGTTEAQFQFPAGVEGTYQLHYVVETPIGSTETTQSVRLEAKASILLTTEKPIYQPGQTIHVRALALDRADHQADKERDLTFELEDSRGNKVFKKATKTDGFGVASAEFSLADEVNLGTYHLRARIGDSGASANTAEIALNVQRYVLPKFKVAVEFDEKDHKPKRDYRPGDHVTGTVRANYFFGKPVENAQITVKASSMDVSIVEAASAEGKTDKDGAYRFDLKLPDYFAGKPLNQGATQVLIEAAAKDATEHSEMRGEPITVSQSALLITAVPEGGKLIPKLDNQIFVLTSYPDGMPASTHVTVQIQGMDEQQVTTDKSGIAIVHVLAPAKSDILHVEADDRKGNRAASDLKLEARGGEDQILLRTERAVYRAGDRMEMEVFSTKMRGTAYVDIVKDGQTILTRDVDIEGGHASLTTIATAEMAGTLDFNAYLFGRNARPVGDHRLVFVQPADELKIDAVADAPQYKPGAEARIHFRMTNAHGEGVRAALGLQIVDEAVFALAEKQPGFAKVFFYLEQEAMKPRYEIHSLSMNDVIVPARFPGGDEQDRAARALFSATEMTSANASQTEFGSSVPQVRYAAFQERYHLAFLAQLHRLAARLSEAYARHPDNFDPVRQFAALKDADEAPRDAWGTPVRIVPAAWSRENRRYYRIESAGPDQRFRTGDDLQAYIEVNTGAMAIDQNSGSKASVEIEHDRGATNGLADVEGSVLDQSGAVIAGAQILLRSKESGKRRGAVADAQGRFSLNAIEEGKYILTTTAQGFESLQQEFEVKEQDRASVTAILTVGSTSQTVTVTEESGPVAVPMVFKAGGMGGGVVGGMVGGARAQGMAQNSVTVNAQAIQELPIAGRDAAEPMSLPVEAPMTVPGEAPTHIRSYFPEALYINPEIVTDGKGEASITVPIADSITTWRMALLASTEIGALGTGTSSLKVFQDFFVDLDLPVTLTQGDRVTIPVAIYNYSGQRGEVSLKLQPEDWFSLVNDSAAKSVTAETGKPAGTQFTLEAKRIGKFKLTLSARLEGSEKREDIVVREIEVVPNGREESVVFNGRLEKAVEHAVRFPANAIPEASKIFVRLYPGPLSQVIEGMDSILRMPYGCFEQTSSSTYPNVLALDYMKRTKKLTPEVHAKAEGFIASGYQRLLTFEVPGGGFSWFGRAPANKILTAYGLMEFSDMAKVYEVDPRLIERTQQWLADQQQEDGSWQPDTQFINEGATNRYNSDVLRITAYLAWSLANTGYKGPAVEKAKKYIEAHLGETPGNLDTYTVAVLANFAVEYGKDREFTRKAMEFLLEAKTETGDEVSWNAEETGVYSTGASAAIETTGVAAQALLKWGQESATARKALNFITSKKDATGAWGTTQATIMALRAVLLASETGATDVRGSVELTLNGKRVESLELTPENNDLLHQFVLKNVHAAEANTVEIHFTGTGGLAYQVAGSYFVPWEERPAKEALSIAVTYDRTKLAQDDIAAATATVKNNLDKRANMVMVDLGIPPGFELLSEDLQEFQEKSASKSSGRLEKFSLTATQAILYFDALGPHETVTLHFRLRAKYPIRARTFASRVYEYYDPAVSATAQPVQLEVGER